MTERSKNYGDVAIWVEKVIDSCNSYKQEIVARKLIRNFEQKYSYLDNKVFVELTRKLWDKLESKTYVKL